MLPHGGWTCHSGERTIGLTHRAGATHRSRAVGAPARWAEFNFPRVSNLHLPTCAHLFDTLYSCNWNGYAQIKQMSPPPLGEQIKQWVRPKKMRNTLGAVGNNILIGTSLLICQWEREEGTPPVTYVTLQTTLSSSN